MPILFRTAMVAAALLASHAQAQPAAMVRDGEWLTIHGFPEVPDGDLVQINPTVVPWRGRVTVDVRVSRASTRTSYGKTPYRSFKGVAVFDCEARAGWYLSLQYFQEPFWQGPVTARDEFKDNEAPVAFNGVPGHPAGKILRAACQGR
ncbi:surface-adhesin E family protein [Paracidovorax anthurii]|uniref:surface-adhesin E family protein n=1 Tax=Paracidovorax anthurii TaxID=78229 RepID=UPI001FEA5A7B|nr:surface-adhesin E family protein [Paracidovorax anthurii]WCM91750.1 hypothetical protein M5C99_15335 [Acidovorax sp. NCPPB 2350]